MIEFCIYKLKLTFSFSTFILDSWRGGEESPFGETTLLEQCKNPGDSLNFQSLIVSKRFYLALDTATHRWAALCVGNIVLNAIRPTDNHRLCCPIETAFGSKTRKALA
jgi:hypothetical protein